MADKLWYRIPGKSIQQKFGVLSDSRGEIPENGIVFSNFNKSKTYVFHEEAEEASFEITSRKPPYVLNEEEYLSGAENMLSAMRAHHVEKAVYSRVKVVSFEKHKKEALFRKLCEKYPDAFCYLLCSESAGSWIGATPEILIAREANHGFTMSLAGTVGHQKNDALDRPWTDKENQEHLYVANYIESHLKEANVEDLQRSNMYTHRAGAVSHLRTDFTFEMNGVSAGKIAFQMHPTPAICGVPTLAAMDLILAAEHHDRELYTGFIGVSDEQSSRYYVNLRCAQFIEDKIYMYLGGGFTMESDPKSEWKETELKAQTLLSAIQEIK